MSYRKAAESRSSSSAKPSTRSAFSAATPAHHNHTRRRAPNREAAARCSAAEPSRVHVRASFWRASTSLIPGHAFSRAGGPNSTPGTTPGRVVPDVRFARGCRINPRRGRWIASKGGLRKLPSRASRAAGPSPGRRARRLWRALPWARCAFSAKALCDSLTRKATLSLTAEPTAAVSMEESRVRAPPPRFGGSARWSAAYPAVRAGSRPSCPSSTSSRSPILRCSVSCVRE